MAKTLISICTSRERQWRWCESCLVMWTAVIWIEKKKGTKPCKSCAKLPLTIYSLVKARYIEKRVLGQYEFSRVYRLVDCVVAMIAMEATPSHFHCQPSVFFWFDIFDTEISFSFFFQRWSTMTLGVWWWYTRMQRRRTRPTGFWRTVHLKIVLFLRWSCPE